MGGVAKAVEKAVSSVGDAVESVGKVAEDVGKGVSNAVNDAGTWIDKSVIQPIKENPIETAVMIAAVAYGGPLVAGYLPGALGVSTATAATLGTAISTGTAAAGITAAKGGSTEDILKAAAVGGGAGAVGGGVGNYVGGATGSAAAGRISGAAATGATGAAATGRDPLQGAAVGAIGAGVAEGVNLAVTSGMDFLNSTAGDYNSSAITTPKPKTYEYGINSSDPSAPAQGLNPALPPGGTDAAFGTTSSPNYETFGITPPQSSVSTPLTANYGNIQTVEGTQGISKEFGIDPNKEGGIGLKYDPESTSTYGQLDPSLPVGGLPSTYVMGSQTDALQKQLEKTASKVLTKEILDGIYGTAAISGTSALLRRSGADGISGEDEFYGDATSQYGNLAPVAQAKYELKKFGKETGETQLIPFKDNEPQSPIPPGYEEIETIGAAKGGLIDSTKSTTMVKYSKKPLVAPRKPELTKKKKTTRKGLAAKQS